MRRINLAFATLFAVSLGVSARVAGAITNAGFEDTINTDTPVDWDTIGSFTSRLGPFFELETPEGQRFGLADTAFALPASPISAETTLGLPAGTFDAAVGGSAFGIAMAWQQVDVNAGDVLEFKCAFLSIDPVEALNGDIGFVLIDDVVMTVFHQTDATVHLPHSSFAMSESFRTVQVPITTSGLINIGFGVVDGSSVIGASQIAIDDIRIVPEPGSACLLICAGAMCLRLRRPMRRC